MSDEAARHKRGRSGSDSSDSSADRAPSPPRLPAGSQAQAWFGPQPTGPRRGGPPSRSSRRYGPAFDSLACVLAVLAITSDKRSPLMPNVPTLAEAGVPNAEMLQWFAVLGPAKLPADITRRLNTEIAAILKLPDVAEKIASQGGEIIGGTPESFAAFIPEDSASWAKLVKDANVRMD